jgi:dolichol-phosphate mannosyltransferase
MHPKTLIIVPTYNERENLPPLVKKIFSLPVKVDLLIVDDNSPDGTGQMADDFAKQHPGMHVLHRAEKNGLGRAYIAGFKWALERDYEFIMEMDGDFSHDPGEIPNFIKKAEDEKADCVIGSRYSNGIRVINWPLKRLILSMGAGMYVRVITGLPLSDPTGGYKLFRRGALQSLDLDAVKSNGYSFQIELSHKLWRQGLKIAETPITFLDRFQGSSKMSKKIVREALIMVWRLWFQNGLRRKPRMKRPSEQRNESVPKSAPKTKDDFVKK